MAITNVWQQPSASFSSTPSTLVTYQSTSVVGIFVFSGIIDNSSLADDGLGNPTEHIIDVYTRVDPAAAMVFTKRYTFSLVDGVICVNGVSTGLPAAADFFFQSEPFLAAQSSQATPNNTSIEILVSSATGQGSMIRPTLFAI